MDTDRSTERERRNVDKKTERLRDNYTQRETEIVRETDTDIQERKAEKKKNRERDEWKRRFKDITSAPIVAWQVEYPALLGNYDILTNQPTRRMERRAGRGSFTSKRETEKRRNILWVGRTGM